MRKLVFILLLCLFSIGTFAQPTKGTTTLSGDYQFAITKGVKATHVGFFGIEHFVHDRVSIGAGIGYNGSYFQYGIQLNYFQPINTNKCYLSLLTFSGVGVDGKQIRPFFSITPAFNYDFAKHWTIYASIVSFNAEFNPWSFGVNVNLPRIGFLFSF